MCAWILSPECRNVCRKDTRATAKHKPTKLHRWRSWSVHSLIPLKLHTHTHLHVLPVCLCLSLPLFSLISASRIYLCRTHFASCSWPVLRIRRVDAMMLRVCLGIYFGAHVGAVLLLSNAAATGSCVPTDVQVDPWSGCAICCCRIRVDGESVCVRSEGAGRRATVLSRCVRQSTGFWIFKTGRDVLKGSCRLDGLRVRTYTYMCKSAVGYLDATSLHRLASC